MKNPNSFYTIIATDSWNTVSTRVITLIEGGYGTWGNNKLKIFIYLEKASSYVMECFLFVF